MNKKIIIIPPDSNIKDMQKQLKSAVSESVIVVESENTIQINGITYAERPKPSSPKMNKRSLGMMTMAAMMSGISPDGMYGHSPRMKSQLPEMDIVKEFELIQQKKSSLTKSQRDYVERVFHQNYMEVKP